MSSTRHTFIHSRLRKAQSLLNKERVQEAEKVLSDLGRKHPEVAETWLLLASIYGPQGRYQDVADCCSRVLAINPRQPVAHSLLGSAMVCLGRREEAIDHLTTARSLAPGDPDIGINLGNALYASGRVEEALDSFRRALMGRPEHPLANFGMGNCCLALGQWSEAVICYRKAYQVMSGDYDINMSLGKAYLNIGELDKAIECYQRAAKLIAKPSVALCELATATQLQGNLKQALGYIEQSVKYDPGNAYARVEQADIIYKLGRIEKSHELIRELAEEGQVFPHIVSVWGHLCHHFDECREVIALGESLIDNSHLSKANATKLHYTLGKLYDAAGGYDSAFAHYSQANGIMPENFDRNGHRAMVDSLIAAYNRDSIASLPRSACQDRRPVFILGMPRSGTSLLEQILASHSDVFGAGELSDIKNLAKEVFRGKEAGLPTFLQAIDQKALDTLAGRYLDSIGKLGGGARRITDKMPANFLWLGLIWQLFPQARIIHCRRDPRDTCLSIYFQQFTKGHKYASDLGDLAFYYREYERLMEHWYEVLELPILEVNYAQLVGDMEGHARKLVQFLDLEWDDRCLDFHKSARATATASWDQVRQPVHTKSVARWRRYRSHLGPLIAEFGDDDIPLVRAASTA